MILLGIQVLSLQTFAKVTSDFKQWQINKKASAVSKAHLKLKAV